MNRVNVIPSILKEVSTVLLIGLMLQIAPSSLVQADAYTTRSTIYDYASSTDMTSLVSIPATSNLVLNDINDPQQSLTLSIGAVTLGTPSVVTLGNNNGTVLTGTGEGQFATGSSTLLSLANSTNLLSTKRLYGVRINSAINLTNYSDVSVTWGWQNGGDGGNYSGFQATSLTAGTENWNPFGFLQQPLSFASEGNFTYVDTTASLTGQPHAKFAMIFGSEQSRIAVINVTLRVEGILRTNLVSVSDPGFLHIGRYQANEVFVLSDFTFQANYQFRLEGNVVFLQGNDMGVSLSFSSSFETILNSDYTFLTADTYTLYYAYIDPFGFGTQIGSVTMLVDEQPQQLTGIYAVDTLGATLYRYGTYLNNIDVYPLYNNAQVPEVNEAPISTNLITTSMEHGTLLLDQTENVVTFDDGTSTFVDTLTFTVLPRTAISLSVLDGTSFTLGDTFTLIHFIVEGSFDVGDGTRPTYQVIATEGYFQTSIPVGTVLDTLGQFPITFSYYVNETYVTTIHTIDVLLAEISSYRATMDGTSLWGASVTPIWASNLDEIDILPNSQSGGSSLSWHLNTLASDTNFENGRFSLVNDTIRFGHNDPSSGPSEVRVTSQQVVEVTWNEQTFNSMKWIRVDMFTETIGELTVSVGGLAPSMIARDDPSNLQAGSSQSTLANHEGRYYFWFPYHVVGMLSMTYTNDLLQPGYMELHYLELSGAALTPSQLTSSFAMMMNDTDSCLASGYLSLRPTYDYLETHQALTGLSDHTMSQHGGITAETLWDILTERYGFTPTNSSTPITSLLQDNGLYLVVGFFSFLAIMVFFRYRHRSPYVRIKTNPIPKQKPSKD